ncbi:MAG: DUF2905 domain-containing protein [bacterium]|nr:MAG: DUF2905 domain-containing protein [bacterium]
MNNLGKFLLIAGICLAAVGVVLLMAPRLPWLGKLPGDIVIRRRNAVFYFPITTSILISIILTVLFNLFRK